MPRAPEKTYRQTNTPQNHSANWQNIGQQGYIKPLFVLCLGVWLYGSDYSFGATIMPIAVLEIGGAKIINWVISIFELGSIIAAVSAPILVKRYNIIQLANIGAALFIAACLIISIAPHMEIIIAARLAQGIGGGFFVAITLLTIATIFPHQFFIRLMTIVSALWGISSFCGPLIGSLFAESGIWRFGFVFMAAQAVMVITGYNIILKPFLKIKHPSALKTTKHSPKIPKIRIMLLIASVLCFALSGIAEDIAFTIALLISGVALFAYMVARDKIAKTNILPRSMFTRTPSGCGMMIALLAPMGAIAISTYGPLFMQQIFQTSPLINGYIIATIAIGWSVSAFTVGHLPQKYATMLIRCGMGVVALSQIGMAYAFYSYNFTLILPSTIAEGIGFGMCWSYINQRTIQLAPEHDKSRVSTSNFTMQRIGFSIGSALLGVVANRLGFTLDTPTEQLQNIAAITFLALLPLVLISVAFAWKLAKYELPHKT